MLRKANLLTFTQTYLP